MSSDGVVVDVRNLSKRYEIYATPRDRLKQLLLPRLYDATNSVFAAIGLSGRSAPPEYFREFWALKDVAFQVRRGETLGIIGRNGSGKSTLLQILAGTMAPTSGSVNVSGRVAALLELGSGFNPEFTGRENVFLNARILGLNQKEIQSHYDQIVEFADIGEFINEPVKTYSSGMFVRLAFAVQAYIDASVVIIDEALAVGDVFFRQKCYARLEELRNSGVAILLVSHSMPDIEQYCERAVLLERGVPRFIGPSSEATKHYYLLHQSGIAMPAVQPRSQPGLMCQLDVEDDGLLTVPPTQAFIDLSEKKQISNGLAECACVAICDVNGAPRSVFRQGDMIKIYFEFIAHADVGMPICGVVISNERGIVVHGKNSWQHELNSTKSLGPGGKVICEQEIKLDLGPGEYVLEVGLAAVPAQIWENRKRISHHVMTSIRHRICHVPAAATFSVGLAEENGVPVLTHHGLANLSGGMKMSVRNDNRENPYDE